MSGVSKSSIAHLMAQDGELLEEFERLKHRMHSLKLERKAVNILSSAARQGAVDLSTAQRFVIIAGRTLPEELFREILSMASEERDGNH